MYRSQGEVHWPTWEERRICDGDEAGASFGVWVFINTSGNFIFAYRNFDIINCIRQNQNTFERGQEK